MGNQQETRYIVIPDRFIGDVKFTQTDPKFKKPIEDNKLDSIDFVRGAKELEALNENQQ